MQFLARMFQGYFWLFLAYSQDDIAYPAWRDIGVYSPEIPAVGPWLFRRAWGL